jgi:hypothetical protein
VGPQGGRFAAEQIQTPETVFHVANEGQPGRATRVVSRPIIASENPANNVFVEDVFVEEDVKSQGHLLRNARTAPSGIALLHLDHSVDEFLAGPLWSG